MGVMSSRRARPHGPGAVVAAALLSSGVLLMSGCAAVSKAPPGPKPVPLPVPTPESLGVVSPVLGPPRADSSGRGIWTPLAGRRSLGDLAAVLAPAARDSVEAWRSLARSPVHRAYALRRIALLHLAAGDSARADSAWAELAAIPSIWQWDALRA